MASIADSTSTRRRKRPRRSSGKNGYFTISARDSTAMLDQNYEPGVSYSLKKHARWHLLDAVRDNPSHVVAESLGHVEITVADDRSGQQFFYKSPSNSVSLRSQSRKRRKHLNLRSLRNIMRSSDSDEDNLTAVNFVDLSKKVKRHDRRLTTNNSPRKQGKTRARNKLSNVIMDSSMEEAEDDLEDEMSDGEFDVPPGQEVSSSTTLDNFIVASNKSQTKKTETALILPPEKSKKSRKLVAPSDFMLPTESETPAPSKGTQLVDGVTIRPSHVPLPFPTLVELKEKFGAAFVPSSSSRSLCAINIFEMLRSQAHLPQNEVTSSLQAYVLLEKVAEGLTVRLNCVVKEDVHDISLPSIRHCRDVEEVVHACVKSCARNYPSTTEPDPLLCVLSNYRIPLDPQLAMSMEMNILAPNSRKPEQHETKTATLDRECGVCFETLAVGLWSSLRCGHGFCDACWRQHLLAEIAARHQLYCPEFGCKEDVDLVFLLRHVSMRLVRRHFRQCLSERLEESEEVVWCPNLNCGRPIWLRGYSRHLSAHELPVNAYCLCGAEFCPACGQEGHWPAPCPVFQVFVEKLRRLDDWKPVWSFGEPKILVDTQSCPNCRRRWSKNGGCNHMTCSMCQADFCWKCGVRMSQHTHGYFPCPTSASMSGSHNRSVIQSNQMFRREASVHRSAEYCDALHLRLLAVRASHSQLRREFGRVLLKVIAYDNSIGSLVPNAKVLAYLRPVTQCARAAQFCFVSAMAESEKERTAILRSFSGRFECLVVPALDALKDVKEELITKRRVAVLRRLKECQEGGWRTSKMLQAILITWGKTS